MEEKLTLRQKLTRTQVELKAPKNQKNNFGNYSYRSCEDIMEALKPLLDKYDVIVTITDELTMVGDRYYVKATATFANDEEAISVSAYAREEESKKGMDASQITGSASSYARKYALNGLFAIDDTKDADTQDNRESKAKAAKPAAKETQVEFAKNWELNNLRIAARKIIGNKSDDEIDQWLAKTLNAPLDKFPRAWVPKAQEKLMGILAQQA